MKVLVIFELIPEETKRAIVEMSNEEYQFFSKAHNVIVNVSDDEGEKAALIINQAFTTDSRYKEYCETDTERKYFGKWTNDLENQNIADVSRIICSGFYL